LGYVKNAAEAEDVTQEVFVKVWKNLKKFNNKYKFKSWVYTIAKNSSLDYLKKRKEIVFSDLAGNENIDYLDRLLVKQLFFPNLVTESADETGGLNLTFTKLSEKYRTTLELYYQDGFKFREIAEILKVPLHTVKTRHRRALIYLRKLIGK